MGTCFLLETCYKWYLGIEDRDNFGSRNWTWLFSLFYRTRLAYLGCNPQFLKVLLLNLFTWILSQCLKFLATDTVFILKQILHFLCTKFQGWISSSLWVTSSRFVLSWLHVAEQSDFLPWAAQNQVMTVLALGHQQCDDAAWVFDSINRSWVF